MALDPSRLHEIERKLILALAKGKFGLEALAGATELNIDQVRRGVEWLRSKNLVNINERADRLLSIGPEGRKSVEQGLPERRLVNFLRSVGREVAVSEAKERSGLDADEFGAAISNALANGWIRRANDRIAATGDAAKTTAETFLARFSGGKIWFSALKEEERAAYELLKKRPGYFAEEAVKDVQVELSQQGLAILKQVESMREARGRAIDVVAPAPTLYAGRTHPLQDVVDEVREVLLGLGFEEIDGPMVQNSFWNFDVLFTPQDHPAREMQDTFYISGAQAEYLADRKIIKNVANVHKKGWHYDWQVREAKKLVLRTHTTPVTIRYLADHRPERASVFSVGRVFRNEKLTYKHLAEFCQVEGIMVGPSVTLRDLMGLQTEFYSKIGLKKVKFWPSFFPYTEPSLQSMVYHERLGKWVELFGMGIFRPEVTNPVGVKNPVLAWGGGLERIAMLKYGLDDVRELYNNNLGWLRSVPKCQ